MGSVSSCLLEEDTEEYQHSSASVFRSCICLRCLAQQLISVYTALFSREEVHAAPSSLRERVPVASPSLNINDSIPDTYNAPPRPVPYDDPIFSQLQHDGLISRHDKILSHFHEESEPFINNNDNEAELKTEGKCKSIFDGGYKFGQPESSLKRFSAEPRKEIMNNFPYEDEDVCPTCLEDYTSEDPKITMQCSHHFHLGCIYEWMERSDACPVCGKETNLNWNRKVTVSRYLELLGGATSNLNSLPLIRSQWFPVLKRGTYTSKKLFSQASDFRNMNPHKGSTYIKIEKYDGFQGSNMITP